MNVAVVQAGWANKPVWARDPERLAAAAWGHHFKKNSAMDHFLGRESLALIPAAAR